MRSTVLWYSVTMVFVGAIAAVAVVWCHFSHLRRYQGTLLFPITGNHGVHVFDIGVLAVEAILLIALSAVLLGGRRPRRG